ncbi:hypothetical protein HDR66_02395, partial [bacterium]|nr:hypothetical protein [bacterium]
MKKISLSLLLCLGMICAMDCGATTTTVRGKQNVANAYKTNQRNTYYMVNQPDVDSECRNRIYKCLSDYCG